MARRTVDWNEGLAQDLRDTKFAQQFILSALDDGLTIQEVLGKVIRSFGVKEFSKKIKIPSSNIIRAIDPKHNPTYETLNKMLKPFGLKVGITPIIKNQAA
jgi:DNA-binding phage protein